MTAPTIPADLAQWCSAQAVRMQDELFDFLRIPSVSARTEHVSDCAAAAQFVADALTRIGLTATPALLGDQLLLRTDSHLWLLGEKRGQVH
jgi:hypothetical protein